MLISTVRVDDKVYSRHYNNYGVIRHIDTDTSFENRRRIVIEYITDVENAFGNHTMGTHSCGGRITTNNGRYFYNITCSSSQHACQSISCLDIISDDVFNRAIKKYTSTMYDELFEALDVAS